MQRLSIVITNYNYDKYVGAAIDSALAVRWPDLEVIVVDDGSTDGSRAIISTFGDRVTPVYQENGGQFAAANTGFAVSSGDVVIFLDSDDMLDPTVAERIAEVWRPGLTKVQFPMLRVDGDGNSLGSRFPRYTSAPSPEQVRAWMRATGAYPTPPGSGNAYARDFLVRLLPVDDRVDRSLDSYTLAAAPLLGDVATVTTPLVKYRLHGANDSNLRSGPHRFGIELARAYRRHLYALDVSGNAAEGPRAIFRGRHLLQLRVAHRRLCPGEQPIPNDSRRRMVWDTVRAPFAPGPEPAWQRVVVSAWCLVVLVAPDFIARRLVRARFAHGGQA